METIETLPFVAGHLGLDFVNTAEGRSNPEAGDALRSPDDLRVWGQRNGMLGARATASDAGELQRAREVRELLYAVFARRLRDEAPFATDRRRLAELAAEAYRIGELQPLPDGGIGWRWSRSDLASVRHRAVVSALELLATPTPRLKQCPGERCGWFFLDTTKSGNRRWCSMRECGQEAKGARRRNRRLRPTSSSREA